MVSIHEKSLPSASGFQFRSAGLGPDCSTKRSAGLRKRRFDMAYLGLSEPSEFTCLAVQAKDIFLEHEPVDPAMARAKALRHVVDNCEIALEPDTLLLGGENPFFFNLMLPTLQADRHSRDGQTAPDNASRRLREANVFFGACFEGHITPGIEYILGQGVTGIRRRIEEQIEGLMIPSMMNDYHSMVQRLHLVTQS